jgi:hypothetical protein
MNKYTRLGTSSFTMVVLHIAVAGALFGIWNMGIDDRFVADRLLNPDFIDDNPEVNTENVNEIVSFIYSAFFHLILWSIMVSFLWLAFSSLAPLERPGQARKLSWFWTLLIIVGVGGSYCIFGYYFLEFDDFAGETDLLAEDKSTPMAVAWMLMFFVFYVFCGTFFTTPKIARTAVPFAASVIRS